MNLGVSRSLASRSTPRGRGSDLRMLLRLTWPAIALSLLLLATGVGTAWYVHRVQARISDIVAHNVSSIRDTEELVLALRELRLHARQFSAGEDDERPLVRDLAAQAEYWLNDAMEDAITPREQELVRQIRADADELFSGIDDLLELDRDARAAMVVPLVEELLTDRVLAAAQEYLDINEELAARATAQNIVMTDRMVLGLLLLGTCGSAAGLLTGFAVAQGLSRSIVQLSVPIRDAAGKLNQVIGPVRVVTGTSLEELDEVLRQLADDIGSVVKRLEQQNREMLRAEQMAAVGQLASGMAHELRNPLTAMKLIVQSARNRGSASLSPQHLAVLEDEMVRLEQMVRRFLEFGRPPELVRSAVDLGDTVRQTLELMAPQIRRQKVDVDAQLPPEPVVVEADAGLCRQLLLNLLLNALDAMPGGGTLAVRLSVAGDSTTTATAATAEAAAAVASADTVDTADAEAPEIARQPATESEAYETAAGGGSEPRLLPPAREVSAAHSAGWVTLDVVDSGTGLPEHLGTRIFDPFVSTKETGLGLGLSVCRQIAEAHGGMIEASSLPAGGARLRLRLPGTAAVADRGPETRRLAADSAPLLANPAASGAAAAHRGPIPAPRPEDAVGHH